MHEHPILEWIKVHAPYVFGLILIVHHFIINLPVPGTPWNKSTTYEWIWDSLQSLANSLQAITGGGRRPPREPPKR
jgi:hypothetical protein